MHRASPPKQDITIASEQAEFTKGNPRAEAQANVDTRLLFKYLGHYHSMLGFFSQYWSLVTYLEANKN